MIQRYQQKGSPREFSVVLNQLALEDGLEWKLLTLHGGGTCSKLSVSINETVLHKCPSSSEAA